MKNAIFALMAIMLFTSNLSTMQARLVTNMRHAGLENSLKAQPTYIELLDSFMEGFDIDSIVNNSVECVHKSEVGIEDIGEAVNHLWFRGWTWENHLDFFGSLGNVAPITRTCFDVAVDARQQFSEFFGSFDGVVDFANQVRNGVMRNAWEWYTLGSAIVSAIQTNRPKEIAFNAGKALALLFKFDPVFKATYKSDGVTALPDLRPIEDLLVGFIDGSQVFNSDNVKNCVNNTEFVVASVEDANREFAKRTDAGFRAGVFEIADVFEVLKPLNEYCANGFDDVQVTVQRLIRTFGSPFDIIVNATRHATGISASGLAIWQAWRNSNWKVLGTEAGKIFWYVFNAA